MGVLRPRLHRRFTMLTRKTPAARVACTAAFIVLALALVPAAFAGKGKPGGGGGGSTGGSSTLTGPVMVADVNGNGSANRLDSITFNVSTTANAYPQVGLRCYQGSNWVYDGYVGYFPNYMFNPWFTLDSGYWAAGVPATCTARLFYNDNRGRQIVLTTMSFGVGA
jgi:hypothetical protein